MYRVSYQIAAGDSPSQATKACSSQNRSGIFLLDLGTAMSYFGQGFPSDQIAACRYSMEGCETDVAGRMEIGLDEFQFSTFTYEARSQTRRLMQLLAPEFDVGILKALLEKLERRLPIKEFVRQTPDDSMINKLLIYSGWPCLLRGQVSPPPSPELLGEIPPQHIAQEAYCILEAARPGLESYANKVCNILMILSNCLLYTSPSPRDRG